MGRKTKRFLLIFLPVLIITAAVVFNALEENRSEVKNNGDLVTVKIANVEIKVEKAKTPTQLKKGLSRRKSLGEDRGMLFYLGQRRIATFWMKGMLFPIDILWIDDGEIIYIVEDAQPPQNNIVPRFTPPKPATHVLEVNAGFVNNHNIKTGDNVSIPNFD